MNNFSGKTVCEMPGLEFIAPTPVFASIQIRGKTFTPDPAQLLIFNGLEKHTENYHQVTGRVQSLVIAKDYLNNLCDSLGVKNEEIIFENLEFENSTDLQLLVNQLINSASAGSQTSSFTFDCFATELVLLSLTRYKNTHSEKIHRNLGSGHFPSSTDKIKRIMHDHLGDAEFNLDKLSKEVGLSKFHMIRSFAKAVGVSPAKYLATIKIDQAKQRLKNTKNTIISISTELGFDNLSTFNKSFKAMTGMSPSAFRNFVANSNT